MKRIFIPGRDLNNGNYTQFFYIGGSFIINCMYWIFRTFFLSSLLSTFKNADGEFDMFFKTNVLSKIYAGVVEININNNNNI